MENYYAKKANRQGAKRVCKENGCETKLSRYNDEEYCSIHQSFSVDVSFMKEWVQ